jgi:hypothetical protein
MTILFCHWTTITSWVGGENECGAVSASSQCSDPRRSELSGLRRRAWDSATVPIVPPAPPTPTIVAIAVPVVSRIMLTVAVAIIAITVAVHELANAPSVNQRTVPILDFLGGGGAPGQRSAADRRSLRTSSERERQPSDNTRSEKKDSHDK